MARASCEPIEFPDQNAVEFTVAGRNHQCIELGSALPASRDSDVAIVTDNLKAGALRVASQSVILQGKLIAGMMAALAEFERDLLRERVRSGIAAAKSRGVVFGRRQGQRVKSDRMAPKVIALVKAGYSYRHIGRQLDLSKNTVLAIVKRAREEKLLPFRGERQK